MHGVPECGSPAEHEREGRLGLRGVEGSVRLRVWDAGFAELIVSTGVATAEEIGMETFEQRLRDEWKRTRAVAGTTILLSAWATIGPE